MKPCPVEIVVQSAHHENRGTGFSCIKFVMFAAPVLRVQAEITDFGPSLDAAVKAARERFYTEKAAEIAAYNVKQAGEGTPGSTAGVYCKAPRKPAGFDAHVGRRERFEAAPVPTA